MNKDPIVIVSGARTPIGAYFEAIVEEETALGQLYAPIKARIAADTGSMARLAFTVRRQVDMERWAAVGESLLDLRTGPFRGRGQLQEVATLALLPAWQQGTANEAAAALLSFVKANEDNLRAHRPEGADLREWAQRVSDWLYSTDHIKVAYSLQYDGVDIELIVRGRPGRLVEIPYQFDDRELGESKMSMREAAGYLVQLKDLYLYRFRQSDRRRPTTYRQLARHEVERIATHGA